MKKRSIALLMAVVMLFGVTVAGTLAYIKATTSDVVNTFTYGDIDILLKEHDYDPENNELNTTIVDKVEDYKMIPGRVLPKDPYVTVVAESEKCWLFVKIVETDNFDDFMTWVIDDNWILLEKDPNDDTADTYVYYREVDANTAKTGVTYNILKNKQVVVDSNVTKGQLTALEASSYPKLTFTAYAVQRENVADAAAAWTIANS